MAPRGRVLLTGATGYVGGRLLRALESQDRQVRCMARRPEFLGGRVSPSTEVVRGDVFEPESLRAALEGVHTAYFLVHSLGQGKSFADDDRRAAENFGQAARATGVRRIVYLGGLAHDDEPMMGRFSDRNGRRPQIFSGVLIGAACIGSFSFFRSFVPLLVLSMAFGMGLSIVTSATSAYIADLSRKEVLGSAMGLFGSIMDIGHTTGPLLSGVVATHFGYAKAFIGSSLVLIVLSGVFLAGIGIRDERKRIINV